MVNPYCTLVVDGSLVVHVMVEDVVVMFVTVIEVSDGLVVSVGGGGVTGGVGGM